MPTLLAGLLIILAAPQARAQDSLPSPTLTVPAGARLLAQMQRQFHTWRARPGDTVYLQITFPLTRNDTILIPAGSHLLATLDSVAPHIGAGRVDLQLHVTSLIFANGYVVTTSNPAHAVTAEKEGLRGEPGGARGALLLGLAAPAAGAAIGAASGSDARSLGIGSAIGSAIGIAALFIGAAHGTDVVLDAGLPMEVVLQGPLTLDARRAAIPAPAASYAHGPSLRPRRGESTCFDPGSPGTPDIVIPGTPPSANFPGTPDVVVPGQPSTPSFWYRC